MNPVDAILSCLRDVSGSDDTNPHILLFSTLRLHFVIGSIACPDASAPVFSLQL